MNAAPEIGMTLSEFARRLGVSLRTVYRMIHSGEAPLPVTPCKSSPRILESDYQAYIERLKSQRGPSCAMKKEG
jgi:excisionase family DNA binding protein